MFKWLYSSSTSAASMNAGMKNIRSQFCEMLDASRRAFQLAADAYLRYADPEAVRTELFALDKSINKSERTIRKELVIHTSVRGTADFDQCLIMMSIVKDGERLGDIAKNVYDLAVSAPDARTCVLHPASTTHRQLSDKELIDCGISEDFIRLSVGLENAEDIYADIEQSLAK